MTFTDLQVAALVWRHQLEAFRQLLESANPDQVASLAFPALIDNPAATLVSIAAHLRLPIDQNAATQIAGGPVFSRNAKFAGESYDSKQRAADAADVEARHSAVLDQVIAWSRQLNFGTALELPLPHPLAIDG